MFTKKSGNYAEKEGALYTIIEHTKEHLDYALEVLCSSDNDSTVKVLHYLTELTNTNSLKEYHGLALLDWIGYNFHINRQKPESYWMPSEEVYEEMSKILDEYDNGNSNLPIENQSDEAFADALFGK